MLASSWSAGISLYGVAAVLGIAGRLQWIQAPELLQQSWVIAVALGLFLLELVIDKIAVVDSVWDTVHLVIRPLGGAVIASTAPDQSIPVPVMLGLGAVLALSSHSAKASARALVNASPEPVSNVVVSTVEDGFVAALMAVAIAFPKVALVVTVLLAVASSITAVIFFKAARGLWRRASERGRRWRRRPASSG